jgi:hypothetical protein
MLYIIKRVTGLDSGADGGSPYVSFEGYFGKKYRLLFPANPAHRPNSGGSPIDATNGAFLPPMLETYSPVKRKIPATGDVCIDWNKESKAVSWRDARKLLRKLRRHVIGFGSDDQGVYEGMLRASRNDGLD